MNSKTAIVIGAVIGLVVGLALGVFVSILFNLPTSFHSGAGVNNQVQVSGTVYVWEKTGTQTGTITFSSVNRTNPIDTSAPIINGQYTILLMGGRSYSVHVYGGGYFSLYVPLGVTTFTANF